MVIDKTQLLSFILFCLLKGRMLSVFASAIQISYISVTLMAMGVQTCSVTTSLTAKEQYCKQHTVETSQAI